MTRCCQGPCPEGIGRPESPLPRFLPRMRLTRIWPVAHSRTPQRHYFRAGFRPEAKAKPFDRACPSVTQKTTAGESFSDGLVGSARPRKRIYRPAGVQQTALEKRERYWRK